MDKNDKDTFDKMCVISKLMREFESVFKEGEGSISITFNHNFNSGTLKWILNSRLTHPGRSEVVEYPFDNLDVVIRKISIMLS